MAAAQQWPPPDVMDNAAKPNFKVGQIVYDWRQPEQVMDVKLAWQESRLYDRNHPLGMLQIPPWWGEADLFTDADGTHAYRQHRRDTWMYVTRAAPPPYRAVSGRLLYGSPPDEPYGSKAMSGPQDKRTSVVAIKQW